MPASDGVPHAHALLVLPVAVSAVHAQRVCGVCNHMRQSLTLTRTYSTLTLNCIHHGPVPCAHPLRW